MVARAFGDFLIRTSWSIGEFELYNFEKERDPIKLSKSFIFRENFDKLKPKSRSNLSLFELSIQVSITKNRSSRAL